MPLIRPPGPLHCPLPRLPHPHLPHLPPRLTHLLLDFDETLTYTPHPPLPPPL